MASLRVGGLCRPALLGGPNEMQPAYLPRFAHLGLSGQAAIREGIGRRVAFLPAVAAAPPAPFAGPSRDAGNGRHVWPGRRIASIAGRGRVVRIVNGRVRRTGRVVAGGGLRPVARRHRLLGILAAGIVGVAAGVALPGVTTGERVARVVSATPVRLAPGTARLVRVTAGERVVMVPAVQVRPVTAGK